jgi:hypothetical protein
LRALQNYCPRAASPQPCLLAGSAEGATMPKGFNLRCAAGKTARVWLQGKGGALAPGRALVLLPIRPGETDESPVAYRAPLRRALIDDNTGHVNIVVCELDYEALKRGIEHLRPALQ